ncbi:CDP-glycerol glycerophosphotransferase family protein [Microlunatus flavus]|uniref:CDP-Glycerol:Poly(Glycerophosphate) glycerophosphotransferase n=1 Tax=Microlunatus flavus TaxID=1036181 RepID=A0A1H9M0U7_9ACTN|nr:CDP-glycerol glycerophosphotransferase family protein [Microlunatus flavus]SER16683.1 CDP-Glycerol:Poly(glycerophosphate) glycerophosphotransferase [Microlunatus flavus]
MRDLPGARRAASARALAAEAVRRGRNAVAVRGFAGRAAANGPVPDGGVAVFFCTGPENLFQLEQWRLPLEHLARTRPTFVVVDRPDTGEAVLARSTLPVAFAPGSGALERLVVEHDVRVVLYVNQVERNFRMLRFAEPVHVQLGHGESDKAYSVSNQHKAYDLTFVGGRAGRDRLGAALRGFDAEQRTVGVGRPQLDHAYPGAPDWPRESGLRVWYAPTWEGDRPSVAYGSLVSHGVAVVEALVADPDVRVVYRPHPRTGFSSPAHAAADRAVRDVLARSDPRGTRHLVDTGPYGWQWAFADACVTDLSSVAYDWLATGKPLVVTEPTATAAYRPASRLLDELPLLPASAAGTVLDVLRARGLGGDAGADGLLADLAAYYFGDTADGASTRRFESAVEQAVSSVSALLRRS